MEIPNELLFMILDSLRGVSQVWAAGVCRRWRAILSRPIPLEKAVQEDRLFSILQSDYVTPEAYKNAKAFTVCAMIRKFGTPPLNWLFPDKEYGPVVDTIWDGALKGGISAEIWFGLNYDEITALLRVLCAAKRINQLQDVLSFDKTKAVVSTIMDCGEKLRDESIIKLARFHGGKKNVPCGLSPRETKRCKDNEA